MVAEEVRGKGKRGLLRIIFGRTTFFILFMALQIGVLAWIYFWLDDRYQAYGYGAFGLVSAILAIRILNEKQNASFKMAWLVPVLLFPVFGCLFYIFVQLQMETKILAKRIADIRIRTRSYLNQNEAIAAKLMKENRRNANLSRYLSERAGYPVYDRTNFKYYPLGDDFFPDLLEELKAAERFIFLEYFIIQRGEMWDSVLKILEEKAAAGVDVRVLYDGMNSFSNLPHDYPKELEARGVTLCLGETVRGFTGRTYIEKVQTNRGNYDCDLAVAAIGVKPNTELLARIGAALDETGAVIIDGGLQTSVKDVYAVGDCARMREQGLRSSSLKMDDLEIARTGLTETEAKQRGIRVKSAMASAYDRPGICPDPNLVTVKLVYDASSRRILGAQAWGRKHVTDRINAIAVAIHAGMTPEQLGQVDFVYSSSVSSIWDPIQVVCNEAL